MKTFNSFCLVGILILLIVSCKKKDIKTPQDKIEGKWTVTSQEIGANVVPGDGSYLQFNACSSTCSGVDHKVSDTTSGTFIYTINEEGTVLTITDNSTDGGSWSGTWDVLELTDSKFRITTSTFLGNFKVEMTK